MEHDPALLESAWLKWSWAVAHAHSLEAYIQAWRDDPQGERNITLGKEYDAKRHRVNVFIESIEPLPVEWGLLIGDVAHNYRSCLDHVAWALVERGRTPPRALTEEQKGKIYFPVIPSRTWFNKSLARLLPGVRRADIAVVRRYQPYHERESRRPRHALAVLHSLSNDDKHRSVQPAQAAPQAATYDIKNVRDCLVTRVAESFVVRETLQVGTQLAPIYVRKTGPQPDVEVHGHLSVQPALQQGVILDEWLGAMRRLVSELLGELGDPPMQLLAKLSGPLR